VTRKIGSLLVTLILLLVVVAVLAILRLGGKAEVLPEFAAVRAPEVLSDFSVSDLRSFQAVSSERVLRFDSADGENWLLADVPEFYQLIDSQVQNVIRSFAELRSSHIITENAEETRLTEFGLFPPAATVTLRDSDGYSQVLEIGNSNPSGSGRYCRAADSGTVVLIPAVIADQAFSSPADYRDMSLPAVNMENLSYLESRNGAVLFRMEPKIGEDPFVTLVSPFVLTSPWRGNYPLDDYAFQELLSEKAPSPIVVRNYLDNLDPEDPVLGLNMETANILYMTDLNGAVLHLVIGSSDGAGGRYVRLGDRDGAVFTLDESDLAIMKTDPFSLISKFVFPGSISQVSQVKVEKGRDIWIMDRFERGDIEDTKDDRFTVNNLEVAHKEFTSVYQKFIGVMREGVALDDVSIRTPVLRITVSNVDSGVEPVIIRYWPYNEVYYQVSVDDGPLEFVVGQYQVEDFVEDLAALSEYGS
jgi:hypothetical protein